MSVKNHMAHLLYRKEILCAILKLSVFPMLPINFSLIKLMVLDEMMFEEL